MPNGSLFKFMSVRAVQREDDRRAAFRFIRLPGAADPRTPFQSSVYAADSLTDAQELAASYIDTDRYHAAFDQQDPRLRLLRLVYAVLVAVVRRGGGPVEASRQAGERWDRQELPLDGFRELQLVLWDALIAAYLRPKRDPRDRAELVEPLRALRFLEVIDDLTSDADLRELVAATALIPGWARGGGPVGRAAADPPPAPTDALTPLRDQLAALDRADVDIRDSAVRVRRELRGQRRLQTRRIERGESPALFETVVPSVDVAAQVERVAQSLRDETAALLGTLDQGWRLRTPGQLRALVRQRRARLHRALATQSGQASLRGTERTGPPAVPGTAQGATATEDDFTHPIEGSVRRVRPAGIGDLLVVEETLIGYVEGEITHVENVLRSESKQRVHRRLDRDVETTVTATEETVETERDLQSTSRLEVASETERTLAQESSLQLGVDVSGGYGPVVQVDTSADFAVSSSVEESVTSSTEYAQEIVDKTVTRVTQSVREEITHKTLAEVEETNTHGFDNTNGTEHVIGIYRWLDKVYAVRVLNYGRRLMYDFVVPEPAAFFRYAAERKIDQAIAATPPPPLPADFSFLDVTPDEYQTWVDAYRVADVTPPPAEEVFVSKVLDQPLVATELDRNTPFTVATKVDSITVPSGYAAVEVSITGAYVSLSADNFLGLGLGDQVLEVSAGDLDDGLSGVQDPLNIAVYSRNIAAHVLTIEVRCERTDEALLQWQLDTYDRIIATYQTQLDDYEAALAAQRSANEAAAFGMPADQKRELERRELKRGCLQLLTDQHFYDFDATVDEAPPFNYPEFVIDEAAGEAPYVEFFEQLFEWEQMTYLFYPYFWGRKSRWVENSTPTDGDPTFEAFLRAGAARVMVPVRPGYVKTLAYYLTTGDIWNGGEVPLIDDELFVSIVDELVEAKGLTLDNPEPYGRPWTYQLPTDLVKLQEDATLPSWPPAAES